MANFVQVSNGVVVNHWDLLHTLPSPLGTDGWFQTVEIIPEIQHGRQEYGVYTYDTTKDPVVISRQVIDISVEDRKINLLEIVNQKFLVFAEQLEKTPQLYSQEEIQTNKDIANNNKNLVLSANTHDELDGIVFTEQNLF